MHFSILSMLLKSGESIEFIDQIEFSPHLKTKKQKQKRTKKKKKMHKNCNQTAKWISTIVSTLIANGRPMFLAYFARAI